jgi:hypothetical protein
LLFNIKSTKIQTTPIKKTTREMLIVVFPPLNIRP